MAKKTSFFRITKVEIDAKFQLFNNKNLNLTKPASILPWTD